jgi:hypothetical protein
VHDLSHPVKGKALLAMPVGAEAAERVDALVNAFGFEHFDFMFFVYDAEEPGGVWEEYMWYNRVKFVYMPKTGKWSYAKRFMSPDVVHDYEFIFFWDDDIALTSGVNPTQYLSLVQRLGIEISQPVVSLNGHYCNQGLCEDSGPLLHQVPMVEIMVGVYSRRVWTECILPHLNEEVGVCVMVCHVVYSCIYR